MACGIVLGGGFPYFLWQVYNENWETLSFDKVNSLNRAANKDQKRVTLPSSDPRQKNTIYFEDMVSKNHELGEKPVRCLIMNNKSVYAIWTWNKEGDGNSICFPPRMTYFLELMFLKEEPKVDFYYKGDYEVDFSQLVLTNKNSGFSSRIHREEIDFIHPRWNRAEMKKYVRNIVFSERLMEKVSIYSVNRIKNLLFNIPITGTDVSCPTALALPSHNWISVLETDATSKDSTLIMVDPLCTLNKSKKWSVVSENGHFFSASLVLTNIEENINKFYILQLLKFQNKKKYLIYTRSGRVGYDGSEELSEFFSYLKDAKKFFEDRFYEKTHNLWSHRHTFQLQANKYNYLHTYFHAGSTMECFNPPLKNVLSTLDKKFQEQLLLVAGNNASSFELFVREWLLKSVTTKIGIPTGKQLVKSFTALNDVLVLLSQKNKGKELVEACNAFYMAMPHDTKYLPPTTILCAEAIEDEVLILQTLAYASLTSSQGRLENPIKSYFKKLKWKLEVLDHGSPEFSVLQKSLVDLHGPTHMYKMELLDAYKWHKQDELERFVDKGGKMLLWHGTQLSSFLGIIKHGLKLPPEDVQNTSSMFGKALYFADVSSKSANYCSRTEENPVGLLLLCEVSMGTPLEVFHGGDYSSHPTLFGGVKALGEYYPSDYTESVLAPETLIPVGPLVRRNDKDIQLKYNEYVIYDERQVKIRYLLKIKFSNV